MASSNVKIENETFSASFDRATGALTELVLKPTGWKIHRRQELGGSFRMLVPVPERHNNRVFGGQQSNTQCRTGADGGSVTFTWDKVKDERGEELDIAVKLTAELTEFGLAFSGEVNNRSQRTVEYVIYPYLGDVSTPPGEKSLKRHAVGYCGAQTTELSPTFNGNRNYYSIDNPLSLVDYPSTPFVLIGGEGQALYAGCHDTSVKNSVFFVNELKPGVEEGINSGTVPPGDEICGLPVHIEFYTAQFVWALPGETAKLAPIVLNPYQGTWHKGADIYKSWRATWFRRPDAPEWSKDIHSWQQIQVNEPQGTIRCRYRDLVEIGRECAKHGVKAIQLTGWNDGGQDRGNPSHKTDPRLGTWEELRDAIAEIQDMGVAVVLFSKFTWADRSTDWFRNELHKHTTMDPYGDPHLHMGYPYQTLTQLTDVNTIRFAPMCHNDAAWRSVAKAEFERLIDLGAAGMLYDECQHHWPVRYCFDKDHGHHVPEHIYHGDGLLLGDFHELTDRRAPDFLYAGEACYDLEHRYYTVTYTRLESDDHMAFQRYIDPELGMMIAATGFNDRRVLNQCLLYRYIISYEPFNFKGRIEEFPPTLEYGKSIDALRRRYREYLWDAEFRDTLGAKVTVDGKVHSPYTVFRQRATGKQAVVIVNLRANEAAIAELSLGTSTPGTKLATVTPEEPEAREFAGSVTIPPRSAVVILEI